MSTSGNPKLDWADCIGMESFVDLKSDFDFPTIDFTATNKQALIGNENKEKKKEVKEYPPPLPLRPWALKRYTSSSDGRLIIKKEKEHREYFHVLRDNGRLTLDLVSLGTDDDKEDHAEEVDEEVEEVFVDDDDLTKSFSGLEIKNEKGESSSSSSTTSMVKMTALHEIKLVGI